MFDFVKYFPSEVRKTNVRFRWQCGCQQVKWPRGPRVCILFHVAMLYYIPFMSRKYIPNDFRTKCFDIIHASLEIQGFSGSHPQLTILCWHVHAISIIMQSWKFCLLTHSRPIRVVFYFIIPRLALDVNQWLAHWSLGPPCDRVESQGNHLPSRSYNQNML